MRLLHSYLALLLLLLFTACSSSTQDQTQEEENPSPTLEEKANEEKPSNAKPNYSYDFGNYSAEAPARTDKPGAVTYNINGEESILRIGVYMDKGLPMMITLLGKAVADKENLPTSFTKNGKEDQNVKVSMPIEVDESVFKAVDLIDGTITFSRMDFENGVFEGTIKGNAAGQLYPKTLPQIMQEMEKKMRSIDRSDAEAVKKATLENMEEMKEAKKKMAEVTQNPIDASFSLKTKIVMVSDISKVK